ncbi:MAG TPA: diacylglycerol kinase family protein [Planctomycetota bacterium]|nr:diacylglycerol kinase family protein [Planctomycetota bacterium]
MNESPPSPPRRLLLIANPISGGGKGRRRAPELAAALRQLGVEVEVYFTTAAGDGAARAARAGGEAWHGLVVIGGDGTLNEVLNGMADPSQPLGVLPVGTANVLATELRLPGRPAAAARVLAAGHTRTLAIGLCDDRRFLLFCGAGLDGAVVERLSQVRTGTLGKHKWLGPILHTTLHWPQFTLRATFADGHCLEGLSSVLVTRVRNYGGIMHLTPDVSVDSGMLHVLCFRQRSRLLWLWHGLRGIFHRMRAGRHLEVRVATAVHIEGAAPFQIDGDFGGRSPVRVTLLPAQARVFAPR